jgi:DNA polymerase-1
VLYNKRGVSEFANYDEAGILERTGVTPALYPQYAALRGDPSDKIPGAKGVGAQTAASLLRRYGSLDAMLAAGKFAEQGEDLRLYKQIATMDASAPLPRLTDQKPDWGRAAELARSWELKQLAVRFEQLAAA